MNVFDMKFSQQRGCKEGRKEGSVFMVSDTWDCVAKECLYFELLSYPPKIDQDIKGVCWALTRVTSVRVRLLTILIEDSDDFSRFLWANTQIIFPTDHNLFLPVCFHFSIHSHGTVTRVGQVRALAAGAVYFGGAKWKRLLSKICELYCMAQSCFTRSI